MRTLLIVMVCLITTFAKAQDDLLAELEQEQGDVTDYVIQTFKGTRVINGHSVETKPAGALEFIISHRFGLISDGVGTFFGLDDSSIRIGLEYGLSDNLGIGIGRSSWDATLDTYLKYKVLRQSTGAKNFPFTMTLFGSYALMAGDFVDLSTSDRSSYLAQALIARKFSPAFSLQVSPTYLHRNLVDESNDVNDLVVLGVSGRVKLTGSLALNVEYLPRLNVPDNNPTFDSFSAGIDIETGGHVFQLIFTNSGGSVERIFLTETLDDFFAGDIHFGFNITRTFQIKR